MEFSFDLGPVGEGKAKPAKDLNGAILNDGERMKGSGGEFPGGHGDIETFDRGGVGGVLEFLLGGVEGCVDGLTSRIEGGTKFGFLLVGKVAHFSGEGVERALFAEEFDAGVFERGFGGGVGDCGEGVGLDLGGLLGHWVGVMGDLELVKGKG